jgi:hypothetical protein
MSSKRPSDYVNLAELGRSVAQGWQNNYPDYTTKFTTYSELSTLANLLRSKAELNTQQDTFKKGNTAELKLVNKDIEEAIKMLRRYLKAESPDNSQLNTQYAMYGLEANSKGIYSLIQDNDRRYQRMFVLIAKLSEPNNIIAGKSFGLAHWQQLQARHSKAWEDSKNMKKQKATLSRETKGYLLQLKELLSKFQAQLKIDFPKADRAKVMREFGFLNEVYK